MEKLLNIDELAEILGVAKTTIYSWTSRNKIPHIKLSKRLLKFREKDIMDWLAAKSFTTDNPPLSKKRGDGSHATSSSYLGDDGIERMVKNAKEEVLHGR